jgi:hypothetical protein
MSEPQHINFNRTIYVDGSMACLCTKDDAPFFEAAYKKLFPTAAIQILTTLQNVKRKQAQAEELEVDEVEASESA